MEIWDLNKLARLFKEKLKESGLKQKDMVDETVSPSTISNLATGKKRVGKEIVVHVFKKLGIGEEELPLLLTEEKNEAKIEHSGLMLKLRSIENNIDFVSPDQGLKELKQLKMENNDPYLSHTEYLIAKAYQYKGNWRKACDHYQRAIQIYDNHPEIADTNLKSACLYNLGRICYRKNDICQALEFANKGLKAFISDGARIFDKYNLLISKVIYLEKLERNDEALDILLDLLQNHMDQINSEIKLNLYQMLALLYNKKKMYPKAIYYATIGIDMARREKNYDRSFELWTTLASSYKNTGDFEKAKLCFETASRFEDKIRRKFLSVSNHLQLGLLYIKEGNIQLAQSVLEEAVQKGKKENDALLLFKSLNALGDCLLRQNKNEEAIQYYQLADHIAQKHSFKAQERELVLKLALYYKKRDLVKYQEYSTRHFELSVQLSQNGGDEMNLNEQIQHLLTEVKAVGDPPDN